MRRARNPTLVLLLAGAAAMTLATECSSLTEVLIVVDSDLSGDRVDTIVVEVKGPTGTAERREAKLAQSPLPVTLDVQAGSDDSAEITVTATASKAGKSVLTTTVRTHLVPGESRTLPITLCASCAGVTCGTAQRCDLGVCGPDEFPSSSLLALGAVSRLSCTARPDGGAEAGSEGGGSEGGDTDSGLDATDAAPKPDVALLGCGIVGNALEGYWRMEEGNGDMVGDCSPAAVNGKLQGSFQWVPGRIGSWALQFGGNGHADLGAKLALSGAISIAAWARVDSFSGNGRILSKAGAAGNRGFELNVENNGVANFQIATDANNQIGVSASIPKSVWTHVTGVFEPGVELRIYVGGVRRTPATPTTAVSSVSSLDASLGQRSDGTSGWNGAIDDVRIYSRVLTDAEIASLAAQ